MAIQKDDSAVMNGGRTTHDSRPVPDPTTLTTQQLNAATASLREVLETRLDGMDKATTLVQASVDRVADNVDNKIGHLQELHGERFRSIETQFKERDTRDERAARDTKVAVDAALQAAEKAVGKQNEASSLATSKSEAAVTKQIDQQSDLIHSTTNALDSKISDIKERLTRIEGMGVGKITEQTAQQAQTGNSISVIQVIAAIIFGVSGIVIAIVVKG